MQSYEEHPVSQFLRDRHPYLEPPFPKTIDPLQITLAVFDRRIPKLVECIADPNLPLDRCQDALHTLNEIVSHQETKDDLTAFGTMEICSYLLKESTSYRVRKEAALLIGGMLFLKQGRDRLIPDDVYPGLQDNLRSSNWEVREAVAWSLCRLSNSRDGVDTLVLSNTIPVMVLALTEVLQAALSLRSEDTTLSTGQYILYLLEAFVSITEYEDGIKSSILEQTMVESLVRSLNSPKSFGPHKDIISEKALNVLAHIALDHQGKEQAAEAESIKAAAEYLQRNCSQEQKRLASALIMLVTINLTGKHQCVSYVDSESKPIVIRRLFNLLRETDADTRANAKQALLNIADLPEGFQKTTAEVCVNFDILDELFTFRAAKPLLSLLPKITDYPHPPYLIGKLLPLHRLYLETLHRLMEKYDEAITQAVDTVNPATKLAPFLAAKGKASKDAVNCLELICQRDLFNKELLRKFLNQYSEDLRLSELPEVAPIVQRILA